MTDNAAVLVGMDTCPSRDASKQPPHTTALHAGARVRGSSQNQSIVLVNYIATTPAAAVATACPKALLYAAIVTRGDRH